MGVKDTSYLLFSVIWESLCPIWTQPFSGPFLGDDVEFLWIGYVCLSSLTSSSSRLTSFHPRDGGVPPGLKCLNFACAVLFSRLLSHPCLNLAIRPVFPAWPAPSALASASSPVSHSPRST